MMREDDVEFLGLLGGAAKVSSVIIWEGTPLRSYGGAAKFASVIEAEPTTTLYWGRRRGREEKERKKSKIVTPKQDRRQQGKTRDTKANKRHKGKTRHFKRYKNKIRDAKTRQDYYLLSSPPPPQRFRYRY